MEECLLLRIFDRLHFFQLKLFKNKYLNLTEQNCSTELIAVIEEQRSLEKLGGGKNSIFIQEANSYVWFFPVGYAHRKGAMLP